MKKIILKEDKKINKLSKYVIKGVEQNKHSLSNNPCFPPSDEKKFDEFIINSRFDALLDKLSKFSDIEETTPNYLLNKLKEISKKIKDLEKGNEVKLINICNKVIIDLFGEYSGNVELNIKIVPKITKSKINTPLSPKKTDGFEYDSINKMNEIEEYIYKRRFLNSLVQGCSNFYSQKISLFMSDIYEVNPSLPELYEKGMIINDLLYFIEKCEVTNDITKKSGIVSVELSTSGVSKIEVEGVNFPSILNETIKGFMELFTTYGLPDEKEIAKFVISKSDFLYAEPWDIRFGYGLWSIIFSEISDTKLIPYIYTELISLDNNEFFNIIKELLVKTKKGKDFFNGLMKSIEMDNKIKHFKENELNNNNFMTLDELEECNV